MDCELVYKPRPISFKVDSRLRPDYTFCNFKSSFTYKKIGSVYFYILNQVVIPQFKLHSDRKIGDHIRNDHNLTIHI